MIGTVNSVIDFRGEYPKTITCIANCDTVVWPAWWLNPAMWNALDDTIENVVITDSSQRKLSIESRELSDTI